MSPSEEESLVKAAQRDNQSFAKLYDVYYSKIFGYIFRRTLDLELSKDLCSETFLKAYLNINRFQWKNIPFSAWLYRIATNEMNMADRKKKYEPESLHRIMEKKYFEPPDPQSLQAEKALLEKQLEQSKDFQQILQKLKELSNKYQEVITLRYFEDKTIKEIADILGKKEGTIKSILSRGIEQLKLIV
jgi:RNA polymerase sigma-70 factor (ECF subfamily)